MQAPFSHTPDSQSVAERQATQAPLPSQNFPPSSSHIVPSGALVEAQLPSVHAKVLQSLFVPQSASLVHSGLAPPEPLLVLVVLVWLADGASLLHAVASAATDATIAPH